MRLFEYDYRMSLLLAEKVLSADTRIEQCIQLLSHIYRAQCIWHGRLLEHNMKRSDAWEPVEPEQLPDRFGEASRDWARYFKDMKEGDLQRHISYTNSKGETFRQPVEEILFHIVNHGTHHRAQISMLLSQAGITPPPTDFIVYARGEGHL